MRFMIIVKATADTEAGACPARSSRRDGQVQRGADEGRRPAGRRRAAPDAPRARASASRRQGHRHGRPVRRDEGARRGLLADPGEVEGRGRRVGQALPDRPAGTRSRSARSSRRTDFGDRVQPRAARPGERTAQLPRPLVRALARRDVAIGVGDRSDAHRAIDAVWRIESARLIAGLARMRARRRRWPRSWRRTRWSPRSSSGRESGVPDNPGAWLMATAKRRAHRPRCAGASTLERKTRGAAAASWQGAHADAGRTGRRARRRRSATTCCASSSSPATRCCPPRRASR